VAESTEKLLEAFLQAVYRLEPTGPGGLEGFVYDLQSCALHLEVRILKTATIPVSVRLQSQNRNMKLQPQ